jgi:NAD(P)-dependent dehydrogenase (short-subunit alcohol dehydrogenase family)
VDDAVEAIWSAGTTAIGLMADVSDSQQVNELVAKTKEAFGPVNIAVSNVGIRHRMPFETITGADWHRALSTNLSPSFYLARAVIPDIRTEGFGRIILMSGNDGFFGHMPSRAADVMCKAKMQGLAMPLAHEFCKDGITANTIAVGGIKITRAVNQPANEELIRLATERLAVSNFGECEDIAEACVYLACDSRLFVKGGALRVNGGDFMTSRP